MLFRMETDNRKLLLFYLVILFGFFQVDSRRRHRRSTPIKLWPDGIIYYEIPTAQFNEARQKDVRIAMNRWEEVTCIKFKPWTDEVYQQLGTKRYVEFYLGSTCFSSNGLYRRQPQYIGVTYGCLDTISIAHEIGHAIGMVHTQRRADRDPYITVHTENMNSASFRNFDTTVMSGFSYDLYGTTYDYKSIMHYKPKTWSSNGKAVLQTKDPAYQSIIGRAPKISFGDAMWVNRAYKCNETCDSTKQCLNGGFIGGSNCQCICPDGFMGYHCEAPLPGYQKIISWNCQKGWEFGHGRCYKINKDVYLSYSSALTDCENRGSSLVTFETAVERDWLVKTLEELKYIGTTNSLWVGVKRNNNDDWIGNGNEPFYQWLGGQAYNDSLLPINDIGTDDDEICGSIDAQHLEIGSCALKDKRGYICMKDFDTSCGGRYRLRNKEKYITTPSYPGDYPIDIKCEYVIQTRRDRRVQITFEHFDLEKSSGCSDDYVLVKKSNDTLDEGKKYCDTQLLNQILVSDANFMIISFKSDSRTSKTGFKAKIEAVPLRYSNRNLGYPTNFLGSFYSVFSSNNDQAETSPYMESAWNIFRSMSLSNILG